MRFAALLTALVMAAAPARMVAQDAAPRKVDIITPHITDAHALDLPAGFGHGLVQEIELPHWAPIHIGPLELDLSPTKHVVMLLLAATLAVSAVCWLFWYFGIEEIARFNTLAKAARELEKHQTEQARSMEQAATAAAARAAAPGTGFDLDAHLESPQAQEGADKYTRE